VDYNLQNILRMIKNEPLESTDQKLTNNPPLKKIKLFEKKKGCILKQKYNLKHDMLMF